MASLIIIDCCIQITPDEGGFERSLGSALRALLPDLFYQRIACRSIASSAQVSVSTPEPLSLESRDEERLTGVSPDDVGVSVGSLGDGVYNWLEVSSVGGNNEDHDGWRLLSGAFAVIQGIMPPLTASLVDLSKNFSHPDQFLYIVVRTFAIPGGWSRDNSDALASSHQTTT